MLNGFVGTVVRGFSGRVGIDVDGAVVFVVGGSVGYGKYSGIIIIIEKSIFDYRNIKFVIIPRLFQ